MLMHDDVWLCYRAEALHMCSRPRGSPIDADHLGLEHPLLEMWLPLSAYGDYELATIDWLHIAWRLRWGPVLRPCP